MSTEAERQDEQDVTSQDVDMLQDTPVKPTYKSFKSVFLPFAIFAIWTDRILGRNIVRSWSISMGR